MKIVRYEAPTLDISVQERKGKAMSVVVKIVTMRNGHSVPRTDSLEVSHDTKGD